MPTSDTVSRHAALAGLAAVAAFAASAGDWLMLSTAYGAYDSLSLAIEYYILLIGAMLGALSIPFYFLGYRVVISLAPASSRLIRPCLLAAGTSVAFSALAHILTALEVSLLLPLDAYLSDPLQILGRGTFWLQFSAFLSAASLATASLLFAAAISSGHHQRLWLPVLLNPAFFLFALVVIASPSEILQAYLAPAALNLGHLMFFLACRYVLLNREKMNNGGNVCLPVS